MLRANKLKEYGKNMKKVCLYGLSPLPSELTKLTLYPPLSVSQCTQREREHEQPRGSKQGLQVPSYGRSWKTGFQANTSLLTFAGNNGNWGTSFVLVC